MCALNERQGDCLTERRPRNDTEQGKCWEGPETLGAWARRDRRRRRCVRGRNVSLARFAAAGSDRMLIHVRRRDLALPPPRLRLQQRLHPVVPADVASTLDAGAVYLATIATPIGPSAAATARQLGVSRRFPRRSTNRRRRPAGVLLLDPQRHDDQRRVLNAVRCHLHHCLRRRYDDENAKLKSVRFFGVATYLRKT